MKLSANLGFLWTDLPLPDAIRAAADAGFDAVECHWPYTVATVETHAALIESRLPMLALNTFPGEDGEFGLSALPGREGEARAVIDQAMVYAKEIGCGSVHVMAGKSGGGAEAEKAYRENLAYACDHAADHGLTVLIEPINTTDVPGYHLSTMTHAVEIIEALGRKNLKVLFDCYHMQIVHGGLEALLLAHLPLIGHVQIAAVPGRAEPDHGEVDYVALARALSDAGYPGYFGAEYLARGAVEDGLGWMDALRHA